MAASTGVQNFVPKVWQAELLLEFESQALINQVTFPVPMTNRGTYIINRFGKVDIKDYTGEVTYAPVSTSSVECKVDNEKYFAFALADIDEAQQAASLRQPAIQNASYNMAKEVDKVMVNKILAASGTSKTVKTFTKAYEVYEAVVDLQMKLNVKDVPAQDRVVLINYRELALLKKDTDFKTSSHRDNLTNGMTIYMVNGVTILPTNRIPEGTMICLHKSAVAYAVQIDTIEAMRLESQFADGVRGLMTFGITVVRPEAIAIIAES